MNVRVPHSLQLGTEGRTNIGVGIDADSHLRDEVPIPSEEQLRGARIHPTDMFVEMPIEMAEVCGDSALPESGGARQNGDRRRSNCNGIVEEVRQRRQIICPCHR
jgi:hypothetical protein